MLNAIDNAPVAESTVSLSPGQLGELAAMLLQKIREEPVKKDEPVAQLPVANSCTSNPPAQPAESIESSLSSSKPQLSKMDILNRKGILQARKKLGLMGVEKIVRSLNPRLANGDPNPEYDSLMLSRLRWALSKLPDSDPTWDAYWLGGDSEGGMNHDNK